jgi:DNA-binding GntR family transcriptional regulator
MMARLRPQSATSLVERVTQEIKASILAGALRPGEQFSIAELCEELDVSHIPVREALRRLEADGLVTLRPGKSAIVTPLSIEELTEVYKLRLVFEPDLAGRSAPDYTTEQLDLLESLCEELRPPADGSALEQHKEAHRRFHELLVSPAAGPHARVILTRLWDAADRYISLVYEGRPRPAEEPYRRHRELVAAARRKRAPGMRKALAEHLSTNEKYMLSSLIPLLSARDDAEAAASEVDLAAASEVDMARVDRVQTGVAAR